MIDRQYNRVSVRWKTRSILHHESLDIDGGKFELSVEVTQPEMPDGISGKPRLTTMIRWIPRDQDRDYFFRLVGTDDSFHGLGALQRAIGRLITKAPRLNQKVNDAIVEWEKENEQHGSSETEANTVERPQGRSDSGIRRASVGRTQGRYDSDDEA